MADLRLRIAELPAARTEPLSLAAEVLPLLPCRERFLASQLLESEDVFAVARTGTKIDVGSWLLRGRVWLFALRDALALLACGPCGTRIAARKLPFDELRDSCYNHVTGELALAPIKGLPFRGLQLDPVDACRVLAQIHHEG